jgi:hypothetical protein
MLRLPRNREVRSRHELEGLSVREARVDSAALETVSDSERREIAPFGVKLVIVEWGILRTKMARRESTVPSNSNSIVAFPVIVGASCEEVT